MGAAAGAAGAAGGASAAGAIAQAIKASGAIVRVEPPDFVAIIGRSERPLVVAAVRAKSWFWPGSYQYLTSYRGLVFFAKSKRPLRLPEDAELIAARTIWIPA